MEYPASGQVESKSHRTRSRENATPAAYCAVIASVLTGSVEVWRLVLLLVRLASSAECDHADGSRRGQNDFANLAHPKLKAHTYLLLVIHELPFLTSLAQGRAYLSRSM